VGTSFLTYYLDNLFFVILHGAIGVIVFLLQMTKYREAQKQALEIENQRTELAFLRAQINPHFLFNTLNNVYSLFFQRSDKALRVIERLTVMLRYGLYEKAEQVPLAKEIEHLVNFIELEKLRYDFEPQLDLQLPATDTKVQLPPLLLITFVENAFKHGDLRQPLSIQLTINGSGLDYVVTNVVKRAQRDAVGGIGLDNLRKRLELLYPKQHALLLERTDTTFTARLSISEL
jgi:LytS/YehU family sensor histidine kinase